MFEVHGFAEWGDVWWVGFGFGDVFADGEDDVVFHVGEAVTVGDALEFKEFVHGEFQAGNATGAGFRGSFEGVDAVEEEFQ